MSSIKLCRVVLTLLAVSLLPSIASAESPQKGVLLLKHGATLSGFITPAGDRYVVLLGESGEARVPAADVTAFVGSLQEAYELKRSALDDSFASRVALTQWCLKHEMLARAADQILAAERQFGPQQELESLHQRLLVTAVAQSPTDQPTNGGQIAKVGFEEELRELPTSAIDSFTSSVQPLLLNRCATGGCHNTRGTSEFVLFRPFFGQATTRRLTERNLKASVAYIDRDTPMQSILLSKAAVAHGGAAAAAIQDREQLQLDILSDWVRRFNAKRSPSDPTTIAPTNELLYQPRRSSNSDSQSAVTASPTETLTPGDTKPEGDPFDPAIFNQRYHGRIQ
ncbi:MAG: hypothetical protein H8E66_01955 [Planctomycetes bacterium]|nr:hypothetical protein [Planctomycetota bacterium]